MRDVAISIAIFALCLAAYVSSGRTVALEEGWDTLPTRVLPFSILRDGSLTLDSFAVQFGRDNREIGYIERHRDHLISHYPIGAAILAVPLDAPVYLWMRIRGRASSEELFAAAARTEKWTAGFLSALAVVVLYLLLAGWAGRGRAVAVALVFGLGTSMWAVASQQLWAHGPNVLLLLCGIALLSRPRRALRSMAAAGFLLGFLYGVRPAALVFAAAGFVHAAVLQPRNRRAARVAAFSAGAAAAIAPFLAYNSYYFGHLFGGPAHAVPHLSVVNLPGGVAGLLLSPNRGLLFVTPVAVVGLAGMAIAFRQARARPLLAIFSAAAVLYLLVHASFSHWMGGWSFGPRYLIEILPVLALTSILALRRTSRAGLAAVGLLAAASILVQAVSAFCYGASRWESRMGEPLEAHAWDWGHIEVWEDFVVRTGFVRSRILSEPMTPEGFRVRWGDVKLPGAVRAGRPFSVNVRFQNASSTSWLDPNSANIGGDEAVNSVRLSYRWLRADSDTVVADYSDRADLSAPLDPGQWATLSIAVTPPDAAGGYRLQFDLVQEMVAWFEEKGAPRLVVPVSVR